MNGIEKLTEIRDAAQAEEDDSGELMVHVDVAAELAAFIFFVRRYPYTGLADLQFPDPPTAT